MIMLNNLEIILFWILIRERFIKRVKNRLIYLKILIFQIKIYKITIIMMNKLKKWRYSVKTQWKCEAFLDKKSKFRENNNIPTPKHASD